MRFPKKEGSGATHHLTLLDGEMVIDEVPGSGLKRRYLIYDLVALNSRSLVKLPFSDRHRLIEEEIIRPRAIEREHSTVYRYEMEPFGVRQKDFWLLSTAIKILKRVIPNLSHGADGLIFQGWDDPYVSGTDEGLLKWKYPEMNSVDFLFEVGSEEQELLFLNERGKKKLMNEDHITFRWGEDASSLVGKIVECSWDAKVERWICMRVRMDKNTPNDVRTYQKVKRSINDNITEEMLLKEIADIVRLPMYADRKSEGQHHRQRGKISQGGEGRGV